MARMKGLGLLVFLGPLCLMAACSSSESKSVEPPPSLAVDAGQKDPGASLGTKDASTTVCSPKLPPGFAPKPRPLAYRRGACTREMLAEYKTKCFPPTADGDACKSWIGAHPNCAACMYSEDVEPRWGPAVDPATKPGIEIKNTGACLVAFDTSPETVACARKIQGSLVCSLAACSECEVSSQSGQVAYDEDVADYLTCVARAPASVCPEFVDAIDCIKGLPAPTLEKIRPCVDVLGNLFASEGAPPDEPAAWIRQYERFCGPEAPDGSTPSEWGG